MPQVIYALLLNYNSSEDTVVLYKQLCALKNDELKVLVIDNNSVKSQRNILLEHIPEKQIIFNYSNLGYAAGNNKGIKIALKEKANYVWILNPDIRIERDTLPTLLNLIKSRSKIAAVGPRIKLRVNEDQIFSDGGVVVYDKRCYTDLINYDCNVKDYPPSINFDIDYVDGSCILINTDAIQELGFLPKEYFLYFEETDWCTNAKRRGWHLGIDSFANAYNLKSPKNKNYIYYINRNRLLFAKKYHPSYWRVCFYYLKIISVKVYLALINKNSFSLIKWEVKGVLDGIKLFS